MDILQNLNSLQQQIINEDGMVIVKAGPGTGKTRTLTHRVAYLINQKRVSPENILTLTFTNRASQEMKDRLKNMVDKLPVVTTFHGFAYELLTNSGDRINLISEEDKEKLIKNIRKQLKSKLTTREIDLQISCSKNSVNGVVERQLLKIINLYQEELKNRGLLDFDDLIINVFNYLKENEEFRKILQNRFRYILIDEFQDTNDLQYQIIKLILGPNLFVIGDPYQSIYGFRGASSGIFTELKNDFPETKEFPLITNYRSLAHVVEMSNLLFKEAKLLSFSKDPGNVSVIETLNEYTEADWVVRFVEEKIGGVDLLKTNSGIDEKTVFSDFAVVYRTHGLGRILEEKLNNSGMPFQVVKEDSPVEGDHIKLLSIHAAKGLEFKYVLLCGFEEGLIPYIRAENFADLEEEKRLLYVAMTRAKEELHILYAKRRNGKKAIVSRFIDLLRSPELIVMQDKATERMLKKATAIKLKKSQMSLL